MLEHTTPVRGTFYGHAPFLQDLPAVTLAPLSALRRRPEMCATVPDPACPFGAQFLDTHLLRSGLSGHAPPVQAFRAVTPAPLVRLAPPFADAPYGDGPGVSSGRPNEVGPLVHRCCVVRSAVSPELGEARSIGSSAWRHRLSLLMARTSKDVQ